MTRILTNWKNIPGTQHLHVDDITKFEYQPADILWICDTIPTELMHAITQLPRLPEFIVGDNAASIVSDNFKIYTTPYRGLELEFIPFNHLTFNSDISTKCCFNFLINKKQTNRYLLIKLVEYFKLNSFDYTWSGTGQTFDMTRIINEWNDVDPDSLQFSPELRLNMLSPITLPKRFINYVGQNETSALINCYGGNIWTWDHIFNQLMANTAVALISESADFEKSSVFTEKTLYAIMALNFPLYIGGYGHADQLTRMGFDVFDDVIDHSYQYKKTLFERCYYAFYNNLDLLSNLTLASTLREQHLDRLISNRSKLYQGQLSTAVGNDISTWPESLRTTIQPLWDNYKNHKKFGERAK